MAWLRWILLLAGALFIALLVWLDRRRPRQAQEEGARAERNEPSFDMATPGVEQSAAERIGEFAERDSHRAPPVIEWDESSKSSMDATQPGAAIERPPPTIPDLPPLIVDWPAENQRRIVTLRILPARRDQLAGRALRQGLTGCGFRHGQFGIFHLPEMDGRVVLSAASLVRPGMLDPATMDFQRFSGINLFAVLPGPLSSDLALERLAAVAKELAARVEGRIQEESGAPFNPSEAGLWRQRCLTAIDGANPAGGQAD